MKAISIKQPWATLIACGFKTIELRTWCTTHRGPLLVCASASPARTEDAKRAIEEFGLTATDMPLGQAICIVDVRDVRPATRQDVDAACSSVDASRDHAWIVQHVRDVEPRAVKGRLSFFDVAIGGKIVPLR
jgi:hypothetical protein